MERTADQLATLIRAERDWVAKEGGDLAGYSARYPQAMAAGLYAADTASVAVLEYEYEALTGRRYPMTATETMHRLAQARTDARSAEAWANRRCDACGAPMPEDGRAEVVDRRDRDWAGARHLVVHQEPCALLPKYVLA